MSTDNKFYKSILWIAAVTVFLLLIPLIAMQFSSEVVWTFLDFVFAGVLIFGTGFAYILITQKLASKAAGNIVYRVAVGFALFTGLFLIWANAAVGIIGSENNDINMLYFIVVFVGIAGSFMARFEPKRMVFTLFAMAAVQALIAVVALLTGMADLPQSSVIEIIGVNGFFIVLFLLSALLFKYSAKIQQKA